MSSILHYFQHREIIIATKHKKEIVIAPLLEKHLQLRCIVPENYDTDAYGTFSGETERKEDPLTTLRLKCLKGMELFNCDLGIASEGSFSSHPYLIFSNADEELLIFIDKKNKLEIITKTLNTVTNFNGSYIHSIEDLEKFASGVLFPSHALILRNNKDSKEKIIKGITGWNMLYDAYKYIKQNYGGKVYAETDMRAHFNPTRMNVIQQTTERLITIIHSQCPQCNTPGFDVTDLVTGLPCMLCQSPTRSTVSYIYICKHCSYSQEKKYPHNKKFEDPMYCEVCNP